MKVLTQVVYQGLNVKKLIIAGIFDSYRMVLVFVTVAVMIESLIHLCCCIVFQQQQCISLSSSPASIPVTFCTKGRSSERGGTMVETFIYLIPSVEMFLDVELLIFVPLPAWFLCLLLQQQRFAFSVNTLRSSVEVYGRMQEIKTSKATSCIHGFCRPSLQMGFCLSSLISSAYFFLNRVLLLLPRVISEIVSSSYVAFKNSYISIQTQRYHPVMLKAL